MLATHFRWLTRAAVLLLLAAVLFIGLIASGMLDPAAVGRQLWHLEERQIRLSSQSRSIEWQEAAVPDSPHTIRMTAALNEGEKDIGYGLALGDEDAYLAVAVSPLGYLAVWETEVAGENSKDSYLLPWQTWPHVQMANSANEIWLDIVGSDVTVYVNREWLWEGKTTDGTSTIGLLGESFAETAVIDFKSITLFAKPGE